MRLNLEPPVTPIRNKWWTVEWMHGWMEADKKQQFVFLTTRKESRFCWFSLVSLRVTTNRLVSKDAYLTQNPKYLINV